MKNSVAALAALFFCVCGAWAEEVTVTAAGGLALSGEVVGFDGRYLRLGTEHGVLSLDYEAVTCAGPACPDATAFVPLLRLAGEPRLGTTALPALIEAYAIVQGGSFERRETAAGSTYAVRDAAGAPLLRFDLALTNTETGFAALLAHEADVLMATRALSGAELAIAEEAGLGALSAEGHMRLLGIDALVPIVAAGGPVREISLEGLSRVYAGEVQDWAALGGPDLPVSLHLGPPHDGQMQAFAARMLRAVGRDLAATVTWHAGSAEVAAAVMVDPGGIGVVPRGQVGFAHPLLIAESCGAYPVVSDATVQAEDYPLTLPAYLYVPEVRLAPAAEAFLQWLASAQAQLVLRRAGVLGQSPQPIPLAEQGERLAAAVAAAGPEVALGDLQEMLDALAGLERQTLTFRFEDGATELDPASRTHARFLAQLIADGRYDGRRIVFVGFSDGQGPASDNLSLSRDRAETVHDMVRRLLGGAWPESLGDGPETMAFGEALPVGCDDTFWGREANRRVELWVESTR